MTALLYLDHPGPRAALACVTAVRGHGFVLDRSIFHPGRSAHGHPQQPDRGEVWIGGDKRWLKAVEWRSGVLVHRLDGAVPSTDDRVRLILDSDRRDATEVAHTAVHLVLSALARDGTLVPTGPARVQGGRQFSLEATRARFRPDAVAAALAQANQAVDENVPVTVEHALEPRRAAEPAPPHWPPPLQPPAQGPVRIVRMGTHSALACDGTVKPRTGGLGWIELASARPSGARVSLRFRVRQ